MYIYMCGPSCEAYLKYEWILCTRLPPFSHIFSRSPVAMSAHECITLHRCSPTPFTMPGLAVHAVAMDQELSINNVVVAGTLLFETINAARTYRRIWSKVPWGVLLPMPMNIHFTTVLNEIKMPIAAGVRPDIGVGLRNYLSDRSIDDFTEFIIWRNYSNGIDIYMRDNCWNDEARWAFYQSFQVADPKLWQEITTMTYVGEAHWSDVEAMMLGP